jgi:hypothetical protein
MNNKISIFYNIETDDLFAVISNDLDICSYSKIGQHSNISLSYIEDSINALINEDSFELYNQLKEIYPNSEFIRQCEMREYLNITQQQ